MVLLIYKTDWKKELRMEDCIVALWLYNVYGAWQPVVKIQINYRLETIEWLRYFA